MATRRSDRKEKSPRRAGDGLSSSVEEDVDVSEEQSTQALSRRMNRILGQLTGINKMIEDQRTCVDVLNQISAVKSALDGVAMALLEKHAHQCFPETAASDESARSLQDFIDIVRKYAR